MNLRGKASGKFFFNRRHRLVGNLGYFLQRIRCKRRWQTSPLGGLDEMPPLNIVNFIVPAIPDGHRQFHLFTFNLASIHTRLRRQNIINRRQAKTSSVSYALEYGTDTLEIHHDAIQPGQRVIICDDLLATGGTAAASVKLVEKLGGKVDGIAFAVELTFLNGRKKLNGVDVFSLIQYDK